MNSEEYIENLNSFIDHFNLLLSWKDPLFDREQATKDIETFEAAINALKETKMEGEYMSKNNKLINQLRIRAELNKADAINKAADEIIPILYAALALALNREYGFGHDRIERAFAESQRIWTNFSGRPEEMIALCEEETGIEIRAKE